MPSGPMEDVSAMLVSTALRAIEAKRWLPESEVRALPEVRAILDAADDIRRACVLHAVTRTDSSHPLTLLSIIGRKRLHLSVADVQLLLEPPGATTEAWEWLHAEKLRVLSRQLEHAHTGFTDEEKAQVRPSLERAVGESRDAPTKSRLQRLLGGSDGIALELIDGSDDVGPRLRSVFAASHESVEARRALLDLLAAYPASGKPSRAWLGEAGRVRGLLTDPSLLAGALLEAALDASEMEEPHSHQGFDYSITRYATPANESFLCGAVVFAGSCGGSSALDPLRRLATKSIALIGKYGSPRSLRLANASAQAIAEIASPASITELLALERAVRHGSLLRQIRKAVDTLAIAQGVSRDKLLERAVEHHGLEPDGTRLVQLSRGQALLEVDGRTAALSYVDDAAARRKTIPADVREHDAATLQELREALKAIRKTIAGEKRRLDGLIALDRRWSLDDWQAVYLDHPVTGRLSRSLIWGFGSGDANDVVGIPRETGTILTSAGQEVAVAGAAEVRLWHPIHATEDEVHAWRLWILRHLVLQPFKQAFREVYVPSPADEHTRVYSNRFAGHVFRQAQARAVMKGRGWQPVAVAWWDDGIDHGVARRTFEPFDIRAEFFFDPILDMHPEEGDVYPYCTSDQVRFFAAASDDPIELVDVPLLVFTEAMRDIDLFVGVTSVGADPDWLDRGEGRRFETYWHAYSFGELTPAAEIRRVVIEQLLPTLAIADRCGLEERFLSVRGDLHTYRIHFGSGNVLMSPNSRLLRIGAVHDGRAEKLFLPLDDDPLLRAILSKAYVLANDTTITDQTITSQIRRT